MDRTLGRYRIQRQIGSGGMGEVFAATDPELQREVAVKVLRTELSAQPELVKRFEREARALAALEHPNIVSVHSVEAVDGVRFLTMELVQGETLADRIAKRRLPIRQLFDLAIQLADAVAAAHACGITHRDLKPGNVMVSHDGRIKVLDFGLAKKVIDEPHESRVSDDSLTSEGAVVGTVAYMSPEQAEGRPVDHRSDIFSLGVILYEMVTGELPFRGDSRVAVLAAIINDTPLPVTHRDPKLPRHLDRIIRLALEKDREYRLQSAKDLRNELEQLSREVTTAHVADLTVPTPRRRSRAWSMVGTGLVGVAAGAAVTAALISPGDPITLGRISRVTGAPATEVHPAISPSGEFVVYAGAGGGSMGLFSRSVAGGKEVPLADELEGDKMAPAFLADGRVAFRCQGRCWVVSPLGGGLKVLEGVTRPRGMSFSRDGESIVYARDDALVRHALEDGNEEVLVTMREVSAPNWSPDGTRIAFVVGNPQYAYSAAQVGNIGGSSIWIVAADSGDPVCVAEGNLNASPAWRDEGTLLFVSDRGGTRDVYSIEVGDDHRPQGPPRRLTTGLDVHTFSLSHDGSKMAFAEFRATANIWSLPIVTSGEPVSTREAEQVTYGNQSIEGIGISSDGRQLLFDSNIAGNQDIYRLDLSSMVLRQLTEHPRDDFLAEYSPDGGEIAFYSFRGGSRDLYLMAADGANMRPITTGPAHDRYPKWSPDGNRIAFYSDRSGRQEIWVMAREAPDADWGEPVQWTVSGGQYGRWSKDGRSLLFGSASQLFTIDAPGEEPHALLPEPMPGPDWPYPNWSTDGESVYFKCSGKDGRGRIWSVPAGGGKPVPLVIFERTTVRNEFACSDDRFYFTITDQQGDIFTMELR